MAFKVNYGLERAERNRAKQAKKEAKALAKKSGGEVEHGEAEPDGAEPDGAALDGIAAVTPGEPEKD